MGFLTSTPRHVLHVAFGKVKVMEISRLLREDGPSEDSCAKETAAIAQILRSTPIVITLEVNFVPRDDYNQFTIPSLRGVFDFSGPRLECLESILLSYFVCMVAQVEHFLS